MAKRTCGGYSPHQRHRNLQPSSRPPAFLYHLDAYSVTSRSESPVARKERSVKRLGKSQISRIIGREVVAQLPDAWEQDEMRIAVERKISEVRECFSASIRSDGAGAGVAAQHLG